jgi:hypothetical protein
VPVQRELSNGDLIAKPNHFVKKKIKLGREHLSTHGLISPKPYVRLLGNRRIEEPLVVGAHQLRERGRIAILLAEFMTDSVLVEKMEDIHGHTNVKEPCPVLRMS